MKRLTATIWYFIGLLLVLTLMNAGLALWSVRQANEAIERQALANQVYQQYLMLESKVYQLFKQYGDAASIGDLDRGSGEAALKENIAGVINNIRQTIGAEIQLVGIEELEELRLVAKIERRLDQVIAAFEEGSQNYAETVRLLDEVIDVEFRMMFDEALEEEAEEVAETREAMSEALALDRMLALLLAAFSIVVTLLFAWLIHRRVASPALQIVEGTQRFADGDFSHRIHLKRRDEFGTIAATLDKMAGRLSEHTAEMDVRHENMDTELSARNRQLEQLLEQARSAETQRKRLLGDVSHELRTPLTIIRGEADVVLRGENDRPAAEYREALSRIREAAGHSARIIDDLLTVARSEQGELRLKTVQLDLRELLENTAHTFGGGVEVSGDSSPALVLADPDRVRQALLILMDNAQHHGGALVALRLERLPESWRIEVHDEAGSLADAEKEQVFERFFRGSNAAENYAEGLGLGLPIARMIARAHGGNVTLGDREGGGLVARLELPLQPWPHAK